MAGGIVIVDAGTLASLPGGKDTPSLCRNLELPIHSHLIADLIVPSDLPNAGSLAPGSIMAIVSTVASGRIDHRYDYHSPIVRRAFGNLALNPEPADSAPAPGPL